MKTATRQILTFSIWIAMLAGTQLLAQQTNLDKRSSHALHPRQSMWLNSMSLLLRSNVNPTSPHPSQNSTPTPAAASQTQPSDSVPGTVFPGVVPADQNLQAMPDNMAGVENECRRGKRTMGRRRAWKLLRSLRRRLLHAPLLVSRARCTHH